MADKPFSNRLDLAQVAAPQRISTAKAMLPAGWDISPRDPQEDSITGRGEVWSIGQMVAAQIEGVNCRLSRENVGGGPGQVRIRLVTQGVVEGIVDGNRVRAVPGDLTFEGHGLELSVRCHDFSCLAIAVPAQEAGYDESVHPHFTLVKGDGIPARMLAKILCGYFELLPEATLKEAEIAAAMWPGLLSGSIRRISAIGKPRDDVHARNFAAMKKYIDKHLGDPDLNAKSLIAEFPVSRANAYRMFQRDGGITKFIQERRLVKAAKLLAYSSTGSSVREVSRQVGIENASYFARLFRQRFGMAPSDVRETYLTASATDVSSHDERELPLPLRKALNP